MKINELLTEGITFNPVILKVYKDKTGKEVKHLTGEKWWRKEQTDCFVCRGTGVEDYGDKKYPCENCEGSGKKLETISSAPELQVSNSNGYAIQEMLGLDPDYSGVIYNKELPELMRKLIKVKNLDISSHTKDTSIEKSQIKPYTDERGVTHIGSGPTMIDVGRSHSQVNSYVDRLIEIVQFAIKNKANLGWA
jgi:hypothetical protein